MGRTNWNHRVVKKTYPSGDVEYSVREVFYNADGSIFAYTESPVGIVGESVESLREYCQWVLKCLDEPILVDGEVVFVDDYAAEQPAEADRAGFSPPEVDSGPENGRKFRS